MKGPGPFMVESCPRLPLVIRAAIRAHRLVTLPVVVACAAVSVYRDELQHMRNARPIA